MPTTFYLVRHGESEANQRDAFLGHHDLPLTALGRLQAEKTANYLKNFHPDAIYSSDLSRAYETATFTAGLFNMPIVKDPGLREIDAGSWEEITFSELAKAFPESYALWCNDIGHARCDGGESVAELRHRMISALLRIAAKHENETVFVFTHATPIRAVAAHCKQLDANELKTVPWATNASVTRIIVDGDRFTLVDYSIDHFMGNMATRLPENV